MIPLQVLKHHPFCRTWKNLCRALEMTVLWSSAWDLSSTTSPQRRQTWWQQPSLRSHKRSEKNLGRFFHISFFLVCLQMQQKLFTNGGGVVYVTDRSVQFKHICVVFRKFVPKCSCVFSGKKMFPLYVLYSTHDMEFRIL